MALLSLVRVVHIAIGVLAFVVLPVPLFTKKGSPRHVSFGRVYVYAMGALALTGVPLAARGLFFDDGARRASALFLFFVAILASDNAWMGVRALRAAKGRSQAPGVLDWLAPSLLLASSVGLGVIGLAGGVVLHVFFALLGAVIAYGQLAYWRRPERTRDDAIVRHIGAMGVSTITTITAFLVTNARHVFHLGGYNVFVWMTPAVLGGIAIGAAQRAFRARAAPSAPCDVS
ncbi:MAG TPA: hypothetical protein VGM56_27175 [Byssovorax sp.]|jgi:uncharacterized membrane protein